MSESTTGTAAIRLHADDDPDVTAATDTNDEESLDALDTLAGMDLEDEGTFDDLDQIFEAEDAEKAGRPVEWPAMPGAKVHIAHFSACLEKRRKLEDKLRERKRWTTQKTPERPAKISEELWREAMFGTVVLDWEHVPHRGRDLEFSLRNYRSLIKTRRFRTFVFENCQDADQYRAEQEDEAGKS